ncbi:MAG: helix-turn-helix domain-containing protein [Actinomycetota bacterium]|nr:helix-turn-helix domain-containing protein [Actinomycetota bacterium]
MLTVPEAARSTGRNPETIRRWIREGRLPARKVGTQHLIEEEDLALLQEGEQLPAPKSWSRTFSGEPMPNWVEILRRQRGGHK